MLSKKNAGDTKKLAVIAPANKITAMMIASQRGICPLASGRNLLKGCSLSFLRSNMSLIIYVAEDNAQKIKNP